jgi:hypothetical protein
MRYRTKLNRFYLYQQGRTVMINSNMQRAYKEVLKLTTAEKMMLISKILPELSRELKKDTATTSRGWEGNLEGVRRSGICKQGIKEKINEHRRIMNT